MWSYPQCVRLRGWERKDGENLQRGYQGCPHFAACEGEEGGEQERCHPRRRREVGALLPRVGQRRVPHGGANGGGHHNGQALAAALACGGGTLEAALGLGVGRRQRERVEVQSGSLTVGGGTSERGA